MFDILWSTREASDEEHVKNYRRDLNIKAVLCHEYVGSYVRDMQWKSKNNGLRYRLTSETHKRSLFILHQQLKIFTK